MSPKTRGRIESLSAFLHGSFTPTTCRFIRPHSGLHVIRQQLATWVTGSISAFAIGNHSIFPRRFAEAMRSGAYLRTIVDGTVGAGDEVRIVGRPNHDLTMRDVSRICTGDRDQVERLLAIPQVPGSWKRWAEDFFKASNSAGWMRANWGILRVGFSHGYLTKSDRVKSTIRHFTTPE